MHGSQFGNLRLYTDGGTDPLPADGPAVDPAVLADREWIRPPTRRRGPQPLEPLSAGWFEDIEVRRYSRHGAWLPTALEFDRHPGESVLLVNPGLGTDAVRFARHGTNVTVAAGPADHPALVQANLRRVGLDAPIVAADGGPLPFPDGTFDVAVWNALHHPEAGGLVDDLFRVLKLGGKVIALFPARFDAGFWQDRLFPLQHLYWRRPADPTTTPKTTARGLRQRFSRFAEHRVMKRHLRRSELPHLWRLLPLAVLERAIGRVLVLKAFKPIAVGRLGSDAATDRSPLAA